uniref:Nucleophile aminohydrolase n=1 Tax=Macrostomum lignano TaxID=282301 RepID=A0A1I8FLD2_9PLAT
GVVHITAGGTAALVAGSLAGPRLTVDPETRRNPEPFPGHSRSGRYGGHLRGCNVLYPWAPAVNWDFLREDAHTWPGRTGGWRCGLTMPGRSHRGALRAEASGASSVSLSFVATGASLFYCEHQEPAMDLAMQLLAPCQSPHWSGVASLIHFGALRLLKVLGEVPPSNGHPKHGEMAYPLSAYGHGWKEDNAIPEIGFSEIVPTRVGDQPKPLQLPSQPWQPDTVNGKTIDPSSHIGTERVMPIRALI